MPKAQDLSNESSSKEKPVSLSKTKHEAVLKLISNSGNQTDEEFDAMLNKAQEAVNNGIYPELISAGSSGSFH